MSRALVVRIFDELFTVGALRKGNVCCDPFGGIGTTGIEGASRGVQVVCCELEPKFVALAGENFLLHQRDWDAMGRPRPRIVNGDSRKLREHVGPVLAECVISSPPYAAQDLGGGDGQRKFGGNKSAEENKATKAGKGLHGNYGGTVGQLGALPEGDVDAIISSPPYAEIASGSGGLNTKPAKDGQQGGRLASSPSQDTDSRYGESAGQLARMAIGAVDAVVSSPPFLDARANTAASVKGGTPTKHDPEAMGTSPGNLQRMRTGDVDAIVSSPPYEESVNSKQHGIDWSKADPKSTGNRKRGDDCKHGQTLKNQLAYGDTPGQLGAMKGGAGVDAIVSSPPFTQGYAGGGGINVKGYGEDGKDKVGSRTYQGTGNERVEGNLETMPLGEVDAVLAAGRGNGCSDEARLAQLERDKLKTYGTSAGQLAEMPMGAGADAVVSSPPYEGSLAARTNGIDWSAAKRTDNQGGGHQAPGASATAAYPPTEGNVGNATGETFWSAALDIVRESYAVLKPGGTAVWVVKAFVRDKQLVDFPGDWRKLCESVGFETVTEVHAMLVAEETKNDLFDGPTVKRRERKSFFRRLAEKKGSPRIDWETVFFMVKR